METNDVNKAAPSVDVPLLVRYSAEAQEDATGQFFIHPATGLRVDKPADGWPKGHHVTFTPIKVKLAEKINLGLSNRDGEIMIGKGVDGRCYLIAEADTYHNMEVFEGLGSTEHIEINAEAFLSLANVQAHPRREETPELEEECCPPLDAAPCSASCSWCKMKSEGGYYRLGPSVLLCERCGERGLKGTHGNPVRDDHKPDA